MTAPDADGWIEWSGGKMPVHGAARVICQLKDGRTMRAARARSREWEHINDGTDISRYRIVEPRP